MTTRITQVVDQTNSGWCLKVEGSMNLADAELLEQICTNLVDGLGYVVTIDLANLSFLDNQGANSVQSKTKSECSSRGSSPVCRTGFPTCRSR